ncbi:hypothetical protein L6452_13795 [Arctium lappa]|uniref:Uncharacterized protein n=1 Tax=Arctium lappa TaxID=4217 RepID=A0ACB9CJ97_ARCLA|nr:hypothetical protein L6452_13795 [Arctium lappa]
MKSFTFYKPIKYSIAKALLAHLLLIYIVGHQCSVPGLSYRSNNQVILSLAAVKIKFGASFVHLLVAVKINIGASFVHLLAAVVRFSLQLRSGKELEKKPKFLKNDDAGMVKMIRTKPMVVETFAEYLYGMFCCEGYVSNCHRGVIKGVDKRDMCL